MSGIPWWTTDVGGYGCGHNPPLCCAANPDNNSPYMRELIVVSHTQSPPAKNSWETLSDCWCLQRWYQFGLFSPVFRTHGCRWCAVPGCKEEPNVSPCVDVPSSCAANEVWSYGNATQARLEKMVRFRAKMRPYIAALAANVSARGVPTMRPLAYEFPTDPGAAGVDTQCILRAKTFQPNSIMF